MFFPNEEYFRSDHLKTGIKKRFIASAKVTLISQLLSSAITFVGVIILARIIAPEYFGLLSMTATLILLLQNFGVNGFTEAIIQQEDINHKEVSSLFWVNIAISFFLSVLVVCFSPLIASFYRDSRLVPIINVMSISILMGGLSTIHIALLARNMKFTRIAGIRLASAVLSVVIGITLALQDLGYWALVGRRLSLPVTIALGSWLLCTWLPGRPEFVKKIKKLLVFGLYTYGNFILNYLRRNVDKILIGRIVGTESLGHYDRAYHLSNVIPNQMTVPISRVVISTLSRVRDEPERYKRYVERLLSTFGFLGFPASMLLTIIGYDLIILILGSRWQEAGRVMSVLGPGIGMLVIYNMHGWIHLSLGNAKRLFKWGACSLSVTIFLFIIGVKFGTIGVGIAYSASFYILVLPALWYAGKPIGLSFLFYIKCLWRYFISALLSGLIIYQILFSWSLTKVSFADYPVITRLLLATVSSCLLYTILVIIFYMSFKPFSDLLSILAEMVPDNLIKFLKKKNRREHNGD